MSIAAGFGFEFNDNITLADHHRISDVIFRPQLDLDGPFDLAKRAAFIWASG